MRKVFGLLGIAILGGGITLGGYKLLVEKPQIIIERSVAPALQTIQTNYKSTLNTSNSSTDFTEAAEKTVNAVVHVKNTAIRTQNDPLAEFFYGRGNGTRIFEQVGTGSGVIISADGFIVTNNHVIDDANEIEITLNNRKKYIAELIGIDAKNDIALLKIESDTELPYITYGNSDNVRIGEWVLAVGNPYNLTSTVTAGIVSAKGRDLKGNSDVVDSFIQTDAAVNPGNSGGALVNTRGELIGINTAISSRTGSFIGYSFAVPSNIARKVIEDIMEFGRVQEAVIGFVPDLENGEELEGVKIASVLDNNNANIAGLKSGDIITKIDNIKITKYADLTGQLSAKRPGDIIDVTINRKGEFSTKKITLSNREKDKYISKYYGLELRNLDIKDLKNYGIYSGVKITKVLDKDLQDLNIVGNIIIKINNKKINRASEVVRLLDNNRNHPISIEMINQNKEIERYVFGNR